MKKLVVILLIAWAVNSASPELPPAVTLNDAPLVQLPGGILPEIGVYGAVDSNSPAHWGGDGRLHIFTSVTHPFWSSGPDLFDIGGPVEPVTFDDVAEFPSYRWLEATYRDDDGTLFGWYHSELPAMCEERPLTVPRIGALVSHDEGQHWSNLGPVLEAPLEETQCDTWNYYFAGGNGDFSVILDREKQYFYFFFSTYHKDPAEQGVCVARMRFDARHSPAGNVWKWHHGCWGEPGLGGRVTPVFPSAIDWHKEYANALWGPSIHFNTHLNAYAMLLNHAVDNSWSQEGIYITFNRALDRPLEWSAPQRLPLDPGGEFYPQVIGIGPGESDKLAGGKPRLFLGGNSRWEINFSGRDVPDRGFSGPGERRSPRPR